MRCRKSTNSSSRFWQCAREAAEGKTMCAHHVKQEKFKRDHYRKRRVKTLARLVARAERAEELLAEIAVSADEQTAERIHDLLLESA